MDGLTFQQIDVVTRMLAMREGCFRCALQAGVPCGGGPGPLKPRCKVAIGVAVTLSTYKQADLAVRKRRRAVLQAMSALGK